MATPRRGSHAMSTDTQDTRDIQNRQPSPVSRRRLIGLSPCTPPCVIYPQGDTSPRRQQPRLGGQQPQAVKGRETMTGGSTAPLSSNKRKHKRFKSPHPHPGPLPKNDARCVPRVEWLDSTFNLLGKGKPPAAPPAPPLPRRAFIPEQSKQLHHRQAHRKSLRLRLGFRRRRLPCPLLRRQSAARRAGRHSRAPSPL
eukprot:scaffold32644_cov101-Isochrysis_galbana.AAC.1